MHELSIALSLVEAVEEELARHAKVRVATVYVRVGVGSGVVAAALRFSFDVAAAGTTVEGAELVIEEPGGRELELRAIRLIDVEENDRACDATHS